MKQWKALDITMIALFVAFMAVGANVTSFLIIGGVPVTLQTFFAILAGLLLGKRLGSIAMVVYMLVGLIGIPIFAGVSGGLIILTKPSFGFILAFILTAFIVGLIAEKKPSIPTFVFSAFIGLIINYIIGTSWMYMAYKLWYLAPAGFTYQLLWSWMAFPLIKDVILTLIAGVVGYRLYNSVIKKSSLQAHWHSNSTH
ncbi:biotin transporter BioY [Niallia sp. FSL W8-0635]|uniref:biotin transporter BioY n=1 Tax=Niallia sp. FSL W8-0635 TaxID=2975337 RepID=UPI0009CEF89E|nr:BioY protein [Mycobacteroides abscessus subsp. abscessus]HEO8419174.1 biotin transporter BioY [Yersinia enterocolitica]